MPRGKLSHYMGEALGNNNPTKSTLISTTFGKLASKRKATIDAASFDADLHPHAEAGLNHGLASAPDELRSLAPQP